MEQAIKLHKLTYLWINTIHNAKGLINHLLYSRLDLLQRRVDLSSDYFLPRWYSEVERLRPITFSKYWDLFVFNCIILLLSLYVSI